MRGVALTVKPLVQLALQWVPCHCYLQCRQLLFKFGPFSPMVGRPGKEVQIGSGPRAHGRAGIQTQVSGALLLTSMKALGFHLDFCLVALREQTSPSGSMSEEPRMKTQVLGSMAKP